MDGSHAIPMFGRMFLFRSFLSNRRVVCVSSIVFAVISAISSAHGMVKIERDCGQSWPFSIVSEYEWATPKWRIAITMIKIRVLGTSRCSISPQ